MKPWEVTLQGPLAAVCHSADRAPCLATHLWKAHALPHFALEGTAVLGHLAQHVSRGSPQCQRTGWCSLCAASWLTPACEHMLCLGVTTQQDLCLTVMQSDLAPVPPASSFGGVRPPSQPSLVLGTLSVLGKH